MGDTVPIVDTDIHPVLNGSHLQEYLPEPWRARWASGSRGPGHLGYWNPNGVMRSDTKLPDGSKVEQTAANLSKHFMDVYQLSYGILNPGGALHMGLSPDPDYAAAVCSAGNQVVAEDWLKADDRYRASIVVSPQDPHLAAEEIHRCAEIPGFVQVLMPSGQRMPYGQRFFNPIYEAAVAHDLPVAIHPGSEGVGVSGAPTAAGYPTTYFEWHTGLVGSYLAHLTSLVCEGVFVKYPTLKFVLVEGGVAWLPPVMWRFDKNWKALRQTTPWLEKPPSEYIAKHIRLTTQPIEEPENMKHLHAMLEMFPAEEMLMFSTDFPHWDGDTPDFVARSIPKSLQGRVMFETAAELYKLPEVTDGK